MYEPLSISVLGSMQSWAPYIVGLLIILLVLAIAIIDPPRSLHLFDFLDRPLPRCTRRPASPPTMGVASAPPTESATIQPASPAPIAPPPSTPPFELRISRADGSFRVVSTIGDHLCEEGLLTFPLVPGDSLVSLELVLPKSE